MGSALDFAKDPLGFLVGSRAYASGIAYQKVLGQHYFIVFEPGMVEHILVKNAKNYRKNKFLKNWSLFFGDGLLTSDGEIWKKDRKTIQPLFQRERVIAYTELMRICSEERVNSWKSGETRVISDEMNALTLDIFVRSILGTRLDADKSRQVARAFDDCMAFFHFTANPIGLAFSRLPLPVSHRYRSAVAQLDRVIEEILIRKRAESSDAAPASDLVTTLLRARDESGQGLTNVQIRDQLMTFFQAGHETTALTLSYAIHLLSAHPEKQAKLHLELRNLNERIGDRALSPDDLAALPYLKSVVQEAMRMYPSSWMLGREAVADDQIAGFDVPAESTVIVPIWAFHRDPAHYPDPEAFEPERWTPEFQKALPRTQYLPFGFGARMCIGSTFAMFELQYALASLYRKFGTELQSPRKIEVNPSVTARPKSPIVVRLTAI